MSQQIAPKSVRSVQGRTGDRLWRTPCKKFGSLQWILVDKKKRPSCIRQIYKFNQQNTRSISNNMKGSVDRWTVTTVKANICSKCTQTFHVASTILILPEIIFFDLIRLQLFWNSVELALSKKRYTRLSIKCLCLDEFHTFLPFSHKAGNALMINLW